MKQPSFPYSHWIIKGLCLVFILTLLGIGWVIGHSAATAHFRFDWRRFNLIALILACLGLVGSWMVEGIRVQCIAAGLGASISFRKVLGINLAATFTGNITPFNSGGVPTQIFLLSKNGLQPGKASAIVTIRVIFSTLLFTLVVPILLLFYRSRFTSGFIGQALNIAIPIATLVSVILIAVIAKPNLASGLFALLYKPLSSIRCLTKFLPTLDKMRVEIESFHQAIREFRRGFHVYGVILCSFLYWLLFFSIAPCLMIALGIDTSHLFWEMVILQFLLVFVISYLPAPGGSGVTELSLYSVLVFIPANLRAVFIIFWRLLSYYMATVIGGIILLKFVRHPVRPRTELPN